ncbi:MAG: hypothetical protein COT36_02895 [Parcubacteria group bacterium CG08_land_8_20_14_0_20_38_56]|nr:MAG: hypothetical protein COT36_02895 [Parcubacteria group bacterium CG08_land_8_20_14_0_20_38_56]
MVSEHIEKAMKKIEGWWQGELVGDRTCIGFVVPNPLKFLIANRRNPRLLYSLIRWYLNQRRVPKESINIKNRKVVRSRYSVIYEHFNKLWPHPVEGEVNIEKFIEEGMRTLLSVGYFGEEIPRILHQYGARGVPIIMPAFLGANLKFLEDTSLTEPFVDSWNDLKLELHPSNPWYEMSLRLVETAVRKSKGKFLVDIPDFGDVFTSLYLMRGPVIFQDIGFDNKLLEVRDKFMELWIKAYEDFWQITSQKFPGSSNWLIWAPGKSYACQCDASCIAVSASKKEVAPILLRRIVEDFIVPEMEKLGKYLDYIIWHLDGEEELEYLDTLLEMPQIKAIQWRPIYYGDPESSPAHPKWIPLFRKIQKAGKSLWVAAENEKEVGGLIENLAPERLYISGGFTGKTEKEAREFLKRVEYLTRQKIKSRSF